METIGYHTVEDKDNPEYIENRAPFKCESPSAWLSYGYYFWDSDEERAHEWGIHRYGKNRYIICEGELDFTDDSLLDLTGNVEDMKYFQELMHLYNKKKMPIGRFITYLRNLNEKPKTKGIFDYNAIRWHDYPQKNNPKLFFTNEGSEFTYLNPRVQICIFKKKPKNIRCFEIVYPDKYCLSQTPIIL